MENQAVNGEEAKKANEEVENIEEAAQEVKEGEESPEAEGEAVEAQAEEKVEEDFKEKFYYLAAEFENHKKRAERDRQNLLKWGNEKVLSELLEVVDNLERTTSALQNDEDEKIKNIVTGIDMVSNQFIEVLKKHGLEVVDAQDKPFDPNFHEAMAQQEVEGVEAGTVVQVFQQGYVLNGRLLRASKVIVAK